MGNDAERECEILRGHLADAMHDLAAVTRERDEARAALEECKARHAGERALCDQYADGAVKLRERAEQAEAREAELRRALEDFPTVHPRRQHLAFINSEPNEYEESDLDWATNNGRAVAWIIEHAPRIKAALSVPGSTLHAETVRLIEAVQRQERAHRARREHARDCRPCALAALMGACERGQILAAAVLTAEEETDAALRAHSWGKAGGSNG